MLTLTYFHNIKNILKHFTRSFKSVKIQKCRPCPDDFPVVHEAPLESLVLTNGMRLICERKNSYTTTLGVFLPAGSMYEKPDERGCALFLEHLLFRRTLQRSQEQLEQKIEEMGGKVSAVAMRDIFLFYGIVPSSSIGELIEVFADVILHGTICDEDVTTDKYRILHELNKMESDKEKVIMDYLPTMAYQDTHLANSIYPRTSVLKAFCAEKLNCFRSRVFKPSSMTMVSSGSISLEELECMVSSYFKSPRECKTPPGACRIRLSSNLQEYRFSGTELRLRDDDEEMGYVAMGVEGPGCEQHDDHFALTVAKQIVGCWDRSYGGANHNAPYIAHSAFNTDLCNMYRSFFHNWAQTTSIWGCYFECEKHSLENMVYLVQEEWMRLCTTITKKEISRAVNQCKMQELLILSDPLKRFLDIVKNFYRYGHCEPVQKRLLLYEKITPEVMRDVAGKYIYGQCPTVIALGRTENLPEFAEIQSGMYSYRY